MRLRRFEFAAHIQTDLIGGVDISAPDFPAPEARAVLADLDFAVPVGQTAGQSGVGRFVDKEVTLAFDEVIRDVGPALKDGHANAVSRDAGKLRARLKAFGDGRQAWLVIIAGTAADADCQQRTECRARQGE